MSIERKQASAALDKLYVKNVRCPYCKTIIPKYQAVCPKCALTKVQIADASNQRAKEIRKNKTGEKIIMTKRRPKDVSFATLCFWLLLGFAGAHNFYVGRRLRGWIMLGGMIVSILFAFIIPIIGYEGTATGMHPWREVFENKGWFFPTDALGGTIVLIWIVDMFAVVFGNFKYPVRLGERKK